MKKTIYVFFTFFMLISHVNAEVDIKSRSGVVYNLNDDTIIYEKNIHEELSVASLTKIMTAIVVIENTNLDDEVIIKKSAFNGLNGYALAGFNVGDKVTIRDLLYALMLPSGAEAGNMLAISFTSSQDAFIELMNEKAKELGLMNTHFDNPIGKDSVNNYSTAYDLAILLMYALKNNQFKEIYTTVTYTTSNGLKLNRTIDKYANGIDVSIIKGDKTGHTDDAGYCLTSISTINDIDYLIVTLGADNTYDFINDHINLYNYFSTNYSYRNILNVNQLLISIPIKNGKQESLEIYSHKEIKKYLKNDINLNDIKYEYNGIEMITKKNKLNDKLGTINIKYKDEILDTYDVYLLDVIEYKLEIWKVIVWSIPIFILLVFILLIKKNKKYKLKQKKIVYKKVRAK